MPDSPSDRNIVRQGWIQTAVQLAVFLGTIVGFYFKLEARADTAIEKAAAAESKAERVERDMNAALIELKRISTILDERLPKKGD